jgi:hypothetical protein
MTKALNLIGLCLTMLCALASHAQHDMMSRMMTHSYIDPNADYSRQVYQRSEIGYSIVFAKATLTGNYTLMDKNGELVDGKFAIPIKSATKSGISSWGAWTVLLPN